MGRFGTQRILDILKGVLRPDDPELLADKEMFRSSFAAWRNWALRAARIRKDEEDMRESNQKLITEYLEKRRNRMEKASERVYVKRLVKENLEERGPLKFANHQPSTTFPSTHKTMSDVFQESVHHSPYL